MFQIWVTPKLLNVEPRYQTKSLLGLERTNKLLTFISPQESDHSLVINQDAYFSLTTLDKGKSLTYNIHDNNNGVYILVLFGKVDVADAILSNRDAIGIETTEPILIQSLEKSEILFIEIPMH